MIDTGTARLNCRNHPWLRWTKTKYGPGFLGAGVLMFDGECGGKQACAILVLSEEQLEEKEADYQVWYRERFAVECNCPYTDLQFMEWV